MLIICLFSLVFGYDIARSAPTAESQSSIASEQEVVFSWFFFFKISSRETGADVLRLIFFNVVFIVRS